MTDMLFVASSPCSKCAHNYENVIESVTFLGFAEFTFAIKVAMEDRAAFCRAPVGSRRPSSEKRLH
jgi:hypothetical protein